MPDKKWYNYFVSVDQAAEGSGPESGQAAKSAADEIAQLARGAAPKPGGAAQTGARPSAQPVAPRTAAQVAAGAPGPKFTAPGGPPVAFDQIYSLAEIRTPAHGYTILKVAEMLQSEHLRGLPADVKQRSVLVALEAAGVKIDEVVEDAVRRDRALDAYERAQQNAVEDLEARKTAENQAIQAELDRLIAEHQARMRANTDEVAKEKERFYGWRLKKQQEEQKIADAVGYFLAKNPITTSGAVGAPSAPGPKTE